MVDSTTSVEKKRWLSYRSSPTNSSRALSESSCGVLLPRSRRLAGMANSCAALCARRCLLLAGALGSPSVLCKAKWEPWSLPTLRRISDQVDVLDPVH